MPKVNINSGAPGNPLDALLGGRSLYGNAGGLLFLNQYGGNNGMYSLDGSTPEGILINDPRYFERYTTTGSEAGGGETAYRLNQQTMDRLHGRVQLRNTNIGGPGEAKDPSLVQYDPELGLLTDPSNITPISNGYGDLVFALGAGALAIPTAFAAMGAGAGASGSTVGMSGAETIPEVMGADGSMVLPGTAGAGEGVAAGAAANYAPVVEHSVQAANYAPVIEHSVQAGGGSLLSSGGAGGLLSQAGNWVMSHPLQAAGLAQTAYGLVSGGSNGSAGGSQAKGGNGNGSPVNFNLPQQQFYVNPYLQAQIDRGYQ